ncbi:MAG TPA: hypothetical protein VFI48_07055 [Hyphomicrobiaceae bacterium]|nr:hypothetical protein [Hyphomicrobiaceae bacterium]
MGTLLFWDGKGEQFIMLQLPEPALIAIRALPDLSQAKKGAIRRGEKLTHSKRHFLFGTNHASTMRIWLKDACKEAGVRYHMHKEAGRHAFVTKCLQEGKALKWVMDAGRWLTLQIHRRALASPSPPRKLPTHGQASFPGSTSAPACRRARFG